ncbi:Hypothetical predicted protein [Paramuricea clavata]|uniref:Uncharacterized protein n=1 Tax=Paramuricea clavata TaxID=317549 RepID=A0A6S7GY78_PARCT|nr:Hypothetical predicted protein [Paramuricea clavata]
MSAFKFSITPRTESKENISEITIDVDEVAQFLRALDTSKACGPDGIPARLLQVCALEIAPSICELFNRSLQTGHVPSEWKSANVTPVHRKDLKEPTLAALYADDTKLYKSITSVGDCESLQQALTDLDCWSRDNNLNFNESKCKVLTITRKKTPLTYAYHMGSKELTRVNKEKDLGVFINYNLSWDDHVHTITAKGNKMLGMLKGTYPLLTNTAVRRTLYLSLVKSQISYATEVWSPPAIKMRSMQWNVYKGEPPLGYCKPSAEKLHISSG